MAVKKADAEMTVPVTATVREQVVTADPKHPALDENPRGDSKLAQNWIDFNDPGLNGADAVARNLAAQAKA